MNKKVVVKKNVRKNFFDLVDLQVHFPEEEKKLLERWYQKGIVKKYLQKNKKSKKYFSFVDGPITANNPMGVHHAWGRTYKDLWPRFYSMLGYRERHQNGFDCQGLWVEVEVEKELGFKNKKDIESFGIEKFVNLCRERVKKYSQIQTEQSKRLGYFADWEHSYYTMSEDNNYMIWRFLKVCDANGWLYKGKDSVPWCPRCETAISQHEMLTEDYKEIAHESVFLAFPIVGRESEYLMVWTTTPWTVPANIAVAVDNNLMYSLVEVEPSGKEEPKKYWVAKDAAERIFQGATYKTTKEERGEKLVGLKYHGAFDTLPNVKQVSEKFANKFHNVIATDNLIMPITTSEGTGLVHTAVSAGMEDFKLGQKLGLPMIPVINDDASYMEGFDFLSGKNAKKHPEIILDYLRKLRSEGKHFYFKTENYIHRYPACWRCKTELVWKVTDEWYIAMDKPTKVPNPKLQIVNDKGEKDQRTLRERMIAVAGKINWIPGFGLDRELDWLNNMHDWLVSKKNRYWGLALPIWECEKCGNFEVIGSREELKEKATEGWKGFEGKSPHKPQIDLIKIKCTKCRNLTSRIEPVGNPWLDAGVVPFSTISSDNKASNLTETGSMPLYLKNRKEWLNWFPASFITESFPGQFKNWFYSMIAMSTVLEDTHPFKTVLGYGTLLGEDGRPMHKSWGNSIEFLEGADKIGVDVMRWMFVRQNPAENMLFGYRASDEVRRRFHLKLWNVYNFFVTYANLDGYKPKASKLKAPKTQSILDKWILIRLNETVFKVRENMEAFNPYVASGEVEIFLDDFSNWYIRRSRERVGIHVESKSDKNSFYDTCFYVLINFCKILAPFNPFISDLIYRNLTKEVSVHLVSWPDSSKLSSQELQIVSEMAGVREIVEGIHAKRKEISIPVRQPLNSAKVSYGTTKIRSKILKIAGEEVNVKSLSVNNFVKNSNEIVVTLDTKITPELEEEARTRELIRDIQGQRKTLGVDLRQGVLVSSPWLPKSQEMITRIKKVTLSRDLILGDFKVEVSS